MNPNKTANWVRGIDFHICVFTVQHLTTLIFHSFEQNELTHFDWTSTLPWQLQRKCQIPCLSLGGNDLWHVDWYILLHSIILVSISSAELNTSRKMSWLICPSCGGHTSAATFLCSCEGTFAEDLHGIRSTSFMFSLSEKTSIQNMKMCIQSEGEKLLQCGWEIHKETHVKKTEQARSL